MTSVRASEGHRAVCTQRIQTLARPGSLDSQLRGDARRPALAAHRSPTELPQQTPPRRAACCVVTTQPERSQFILASYEHQTGVRLSLSACLSTAFSTEEKNRLYTSRDCCIICDCFTPLWKTLICWPLHGWALFWSSANQLQVYCYWRRDAVRKTGKFKLAITL